jgi:hydrogenase maturation protease
MNPWNPLEESPAIDSIRVFGADLKQGDRVRLRPQKTADILDLVLAGQIAQIEAIELDFEGHIHLAVVLDDDPGRDLGTLRQPGHRFFFSPDEVEPLARDGPVDTEDRS